MDVHSTGPDIEAPFREAAAEGRLSLQRCARCSTVSSYPRRRCPHCLSDDLSWIGLSGDGTVQAYTKPAGHAGADDALVSIIELAEGVRVTGRLLTAGMTRLQPGMPVKLIDPSGEPEDMSAVLTFVPVAGRPLA
ncbi:hypothetical protein EEB14_32950 [Rhodococcus sp. WS4]|nr:hypothetical protein EEB14_32950 [Rhodococcus sp. WS4]